MGPKIGIIENDISLNEIFTESTCLKFVNINIYKSSAIFQHDICK